MKKLSHKQLLTLLRSTNLFLGALMVVTLSYVVITREHTQAAGTTLADAQTALVTAISGVQTASSSVATLLTQNNTSATQVLTTAVSQGISAIGTSSAKLTSMVNLNPTVMANMVTASIAQGVSAGTVSLAQITNAAKITNSSASALVTTAVQQGVAAGTVNLTQITSITTLKTADISTLINTALSQGVAAGTVNLNQVTSITTLTPAGLSNAVTVAVNEAMKNGAVLTIAQQTLIINQAIAGLPAAGMFDVTALKNAVATQIVAVSGTGNVATIVSGLTSGTVVAFQNAVMSAAQSSALSQITALAGTVNLSTIQNTIASSVITETGLGTVAGIAGSLGTATTQGFANLVQGSVITQAMSSIQGLGGTVDFTAAKNAIAGSIIGSTGLGTIAGITGSFNAATASQFTEAIKGAITSNALTSLAALGTTVDITSIQNAIAGNIKGITGLGSFATISASLTNINATSLTAAIKDSAIQNVLSQLNITGDLSAANIQNLIGTQITSLTGFGSLGAITGAINVNVVTALGGIMSVQQQLTTVMAGLGSQLTNLTSLASDLSNNVLSNLSAFSLVGINTNIANIQTAVTAALGTISGPLTSAIGSISTAATGIFASGSASAANLASISAANSSVTTSATALNTNSAASNSNSTSASNSASSSGGGAATPFGGLSTYVFYCTCSSNIAITINDLTITPPLTLPIIYQPGGTILYPYGQVFTSGVWLLGLWTSGGNCQYYVGKGCSTYTTQGMMTMVGTSM